MKDKKVYVLKKDEFDFFEKEVAFWIGILGLQNYEIWLRSDQDFEGDAGCSLEDESSRSVDICLNPKWATKPTKRLISLAAFHECCEVLLRPLRLRLNTFYSFEYVDKEIHKIIVTLQNTLFKIVWKLKNKKEWNLLL